MDDNFDQLVIDVRARTDGFASDVESMRRSVDSTLVDGFGRAGTVLENGLLGALRRGSLGFDDLKRVAFNALSEIASYALQSGISSLFGGVGGSSSGGGGLGNLIGQTLGSLFGVPAQPTGGGIAPARASQTSLAAPAIGSLFGLPGQAAGGPVTPAGASRVSLVSPAGPSVRTGPTTSTAPTAPTVGSLLGFPGRATGGPVAPSRPYLVGERGPEVFVPTAAGRVETGSSVAAPGRDVRVAIQVAVPRGQAAPTAMQRSSRQIASAVRRALQQA